MGWRKAEQPRLGAHYFRRMQIQIQQVSQLQTLVALHKGKHKSLNRAARSLLKIVCCWLKRMRYKWSQLLFLSHRPTRPQITKLPLSKPQPETFSTSGHREFLGMCCWCVMDKTVCGPEDGKRENKHAHSREIPWRGTGKQGELTDTPAPQKVKLAPS